MKFILSQHSKKRIAQRGISLDVCKSVIKNPDRKISQGKGESGGVLYRYEKDFNNEIITIVAVAETLKSKDIKIITVFKKEKE